MCLWGKKNAARLEKLYVDSVVSKVFESRTGQGDGVNVATPWSRGGASLARSGASGAARDYIDIYVNFLVCFALMQSAGDAEVSDGLGLFWAVRQFWLQLSHFPLGIRAALNTPIREDHDGTLDGPADARRPMIFNLLGPCAIDRGKMQQRHLDRAQTTRQRVRRWARQRY